MQPRNPENGPSALSCRLCSAPGIELVLELPSAPRSVERLLQASALEGDGPCHLKAYQCGVCGLVQLPEPMETGFYDDYEMATSFSPNFRGYLSELANMFCATFEDARGRLLEVGCGDGTFMSCLSERGFEVYGVEPSRPFRSAAEEKGFRVFDTYVGPDSPVAGAPYDAFVTRQVLEHVFDIQGFLRGIRMSVAPGAPGLVEVPNLAKSVSDRRFYDFFPDHVNYFSSHALRRALEVNGFDVFDVVPTMNGEFITAFARRSGLTDMGPMRSAMETLRESYAVFVETHRKTGRKFAVWGSGGKGVALLAALGGHDVAYVVDTDPRKQGLFMPVCHLQVFAPGRLRTDLVDTVLVTALAHLEEILDQLRGELSFQGNIAILGDEIRYTE